MKSSSGTSDFLIINNIDMNFRADIECVFCFSIISCFNFIREIHDNRLIIK